MPKMKSHRGAAKRFKLTGTGKVRRRKPFASHFQAKKSGKRTRHLRKGAAVARSEVRTIKRILSGG